VHADDVAEVEVGEHGVRVVTQLVFPEIELDATRRIGEVREGRLAMRAPCNDASRHLHRKTFSGVTEKH
jgi:hypothetical protein